MKKTLTEQKENGRIYTPVYIVNNILDLSNYYGKSILKKHIIDNSCGDGAFLCKIVERYCTVAIDNNMTLSELKNDLEIYIHGIELNSVEANKCIINVSNIAFLFGVENVNWDIICDDATTVNKFNGKIDFVFGNPPYVRVHNLGSSFNSVKKFTFAQNGMTDLFIVFYELGLRMLSKNGVLGYITPSSFFNSLAGSYMRKVLVNDNLIDKIVDLKHFQAFNATTYTTIVILKKNKQNNNISYYQFDEQKKIPYYVDTLTPNDFFICGNFYFSKKENLLILSKIFHNLGECDVSVKNGYATLCDDVFISDFEFSSDYIIPVIKSSRGTTSKMFYPYDKEGNLILESKLKEDYNMYRYLTQNKNKLLKRSNEKDNNLYWYAFGRSQAIKDTFKDKLSINSLLRDESDLKFVDVAAGVGVYGGLYLVSESIPAEDIKKALKSSEFMTYISLLGKYKSGGYYTFSSKDLKIYLNYKFAYNRGLFVC